MFTRNGDTVTWPEPAIKPRNIRRDRDGLARCRVCRCTDREPCNPPCRWSECDLCSTCAEAAATIHEWTLAAVRPNFIGLMGEVRKRIDEEIAAAEMPPRRKKR